MDGAKLNESKKSSDVYLISHQMVSEHGTWYEASDVIKHFYKKCNIDEIMVS